VFKNTTLNKFAQNKEEVIIAWKNGIRNSCTGFDRC